MPRGDRTGPWGMGPMTGRAAGYCAGYGVPGFANPVVWGGMGRGFWGRGGGRGWRHWYYATGLPAWARWGAAFPPVVPWGVPPKVKPEDEAEALREQAEYLRGMLEDIQKRLEELSK
ncbi:MAG: hypothetical protein FJZ90_08635 [Chloroflexi bacterium]|nr:hypothetical protein [Chloroflexota bacterium]